MKFRGTHETPPGIGDMGHPSFVEGFWTLIIRNSVSDLPRAISRKRGATLAVAQSIESQLLDRVYDGRHSLVIEKRGTPKAVLLSIRDYVNLAAPEPEVLRILGVESGTQRNQRPYSPAD